MTLHWWTKSDVLFKKAAKKLDIPPGMVVHNILLRDLQELGHYQELQKDPEKQLLLFP